MGVYLEQRRKYSYALLQLQYAIFERKSEAKTVSNKLYFLDRENHTDNSGLLFIWTLQRFSGQLTDAETSNVSLVDLNEKLEIAKKFENVLNKKLLGVGH